MACLQLKLIYFMPIISYKEKGQISKQWLKGKQITPNFPKNYYFLPPDMHT